MCNGWNIVFFIVTILIINSIDIYINEGYLILSIVNFINLCIIAIGFILDVKEHKRGI